MSVATQLGLADPARWEAVAAAAGIELTWAPDFAGLLD